MSTLTLGSRPAAPAVLRFSSRSVDPAMDELLARLGADFPLAFRPDRVLALGVRSELLSRGYGPPALLGAVLRRWVRRHSYLKAVARGGYRTALDGSVAGVITPEQREQAKADLQARATPRADACPNAGGCRRAAPSAARQRHPSPTHCHPLKEPENAHPDTPAASERGHLG